MTLMVRSFLALVFLVVCQALPSLALAQQERPVDAAALLEEARKDVDAVRTAPRDAASDAQLNELRNRALAAQAKADKAEAGMAPNLADVTARLAELGTPTPGTTEAADVAAQRKELARTQATLDSQVKLARLLSLEAQQAAKAVVAQRRQQFGERLSERTPSPLSATFWTDLKRELPADAAKLRQFTSALVPAIASVSVPVWIGMVVLMAAIVAGHVVLRQALVRVASNRIPPGQLRRSMHALGVVLLWVLTPGLMAHVVSVGLSTVETAPTDAIAQLTALEGIIWFGGFTYGLGTALLMAGSPSWRLPSISDELALRLKWFPLALALTSVVGWSLARVALTIEASLAATVALNTLMALSYMLIALAALLRLGPGRQPDGSSVDSATSSETASAAPEASVPVWVAVLRTAAWGLLAVTFGALLLGYVAFSAFISNQFVWCLIIGGAAYLLAVVVDDLCRSLLGNTKAGQADGKEPAAQEEKTDYLARTRAQAAVLVSAIVRVGIYFLGLLLILAPYGEGPLELLNRAGRINEGLSIGEVSLKPGALLQAALLLVLGLAAVRLFKRWLTDRFMPTTQMDAGMRMSIITLSGYAGTVVIIALAISAVGMGLERVTWVASALSVGIGFGLQAIVQNFVSGLILLAERPVKVGDWVSVSGVEGDIRKINVRATEIQMGDRSTLIIPNSEFITKIVRNVTYSDNIGLVQVKLPMPLSTDTKAAREVLIEAFRNHRGVLSTPAPTVQLEGVTDGRLVFVATGFVNSPRAAGNVKSELLFDIFEKLRAAHITLEQPAAIVMKPSP